jgi:hypothetical protein
MTDLNAPAALMCHYTRAETAFEKILPEGRLWMNPYSKMRDPFENQYPFFQSAGGWGDSEAQEKLFWELQRKVMVSRERHSLLALTEGDPRPGSAIERVFARLAQAPRVVDQAKAAQRERSAIELVVGVQGSEQAAHRRRSTHRGTCWAASTCP